MAVLRGRRIEAAWTALIVAVAVLGLLMSEGEPVCEGPFIFQVDDSLPPQCPSPVEFLPTVAIAWVVGLGVIFGIRALVTSSSRRRQQQPT
ncbi:MAG: hypothetical protein KA758_03790 [Acidimicrobiales bacterium]|nr:hypothetical protein [Acidimicrobiales bacterium]